MVMSSYGVRHGLKPEAERPLSLRDAREEKDIREEGLASFFRRLDGGLISLGFQPVAKAFRNISSYGFTLSI